MIRDMTRNSRILSALFIISLGLNVAFISYSVTKSYKNQHKTLEMASQQRLEAVLKILPEASRENVRMRLAPNLPKEEANMKQMRQERRHIAQMLSAPQVDSNALKASFAHIRQIRNENQQLYQDALADASATLPQADRQKIISNLNTP